MDSNQIRSIMLKAFKSLTVSQIEILQLFSSVVKVRVIAEGYAKQSIPERVEILTTLLRSESLELSLNYAISFEPLTPSEYTEWNNSENEIAGTSTNRSGMAARDLET